MMVVVGFEALITCSAELGPPYEASARLGPTCARHSLYGVLTYGPKSRVFSNSGHSGLPKQESENSE